MAPIVEFLVEATIQVGGEIGGEAIYRRYSWLGCATVILISAVVIAVIWYVLQ